MGMLKSSSGLVDGTSGGSVLWFVCSGPGIIADVLQKRRERLDSRSLSHPIANASSFLSVHAVSPDPTCKITFEFGSKPFAAPDPLVARSHISWTVVALSLTRGGGCVERIQFRALLSIGSPVAAHTPNSCVYDILGPKFHHYRHQPGFKSGLKFGWGGVQREKDFRVGGPPN